MKNRNYCFTAYKLPEPTLDHIVYMIYGEEKCPDTGRLHYQGYVELETATRLNAVKTIFNDETLHLEKRKGTQQQAIDYCKKDGVFTEHGTPAKQGKRTDLKKIIDDNKTIEDVMDKEPQVYCQYRKGLQDIYARKTEITIPEIRPVIVCVYWGVTGSGKTYKARTENPDYYQMRYMNKGERAFFDGYRGQKTLIIDEFYGQIPYPLLLQLLDVYKLQVDIKGGTTWAQWNKVVITSNAPPAMWYPDQQYIDPLLRRITITQEFKKTYEEPEEEEKMDRPLTERPYKRARTELTDNIDNFVIDVLSDSDVCNAEPDNCVNQARV